MAKFDDEEDPNEVTLFDIQNDLDTLHGKNIKKFSTLLIDFVNERTTEYLMLNKIAFV